MILFLVVVVVIVAVGAGALAYRNRPESSIEAGIHSFRREMRALAPPSQRPRPPADGAPGAEPPGPREHGEPPATGVQ